MFTSIFRRLVGSRLKVCSQINAFSFSEKKYYPCRNFSHDIKNECWINPPYKTEEEKQKYFEQQEINKKYEEKLAVDRKYYAEFYNQLTERKKEDENLRMKSIEKEKEIARLKELENEQLKIEEDKNKKDNNWLPWAFLLWCLWS